MEDRFQDIDPITEPHERVRDANDLFSRLWLHLPLHKLTLSPSSPTIEAATAKKCSKQAPKKKESWYGIRASPRTAKSPMCSKPSIPASRLRLIVPVPQNLTRRLLGEAQSRRSIADLIETTPPTLMVMRDNKLLMPYHSPHLNAYPGDSKEDADKGRVYWTTDRESIIGLGYNKNMIGPAEVPKSFADLAKPQNKGKIGVSGDSTGVRFIGALIRAKGEEFVKQLKALDIKLHMISGGALHAAGEMPMPVSIFRNHVLAAKPKGAPSEWVPLDLNPTNSGGVALPAGSNNPHAALLLADFLLSPEGQRIFEERFRFATSTKNYGFKRWYPEKGYTTEQYEKSEERWKKLLRDIVLR